jgi:hypothetical protein
VAAGSTGAARPVAGGRPYARWRRRSEPLVCQLFEDALRQSGFVAGENVRIEYHWASGRYDRLPKIAAELVSRRVAVIVAGTPVAAP